MGTYWGICALYATNNPNTRSQGRKCKSEIFKGLDLLGINAMATVQISKEVHDYLKIAKVKGDYRRLNDVIADAIDIDNVSE